MTQKSGYEIRLELLKLAKDVLLERFNTERDLAMQEWHINAQMAMEGKQTLPPIPEFTSYVSANDILKEADKLYQFVSSSK